MNDYLHRDSDTLIVTYGFMRKMVAEARKRDAAIARYKTIARHKKLLLKGLDPVRLAHGFAMKYGLMADMTREQANALEEALTIYLTAAVAALEEDRKEATK